ncbi:MAG: class I SAM-dependent RNA methyltransferase [Actinomycetes bacterium]
MAAQPSSSPAPEVGVVLNGLSVERMVAGGLGLSHEPEGRVVLVRGGLPGEVVDVEITESKDRLLRADAVRISAPATGRTDPPCPEVARGCGGCDLQHADLPTQRAMAVSVVADALTRIGRLPDVRVEVGPDLPGERFRTTLRCAVDGDRLGFRRHQSRAVLTVDDCLVAHPLAAEVVRDGRFPGAREVVVRVGARTNEVLVVVHPTWDDVWVPEGARVVGTDELDAGVRAWMHEEIAGRRFRISARSFFQASPDGAEALVDAVRRALEPESSDRLVDLYGGVGLFAGTLGVESPIVVERSASSAADARINLADVNATVIKVAVERWTPTPADVVVADPARSGLGADGAGAVVGTGARRVALVSCDPASLARDARLLVDAGYTLDRVELVGMFPHTHHIEAVSTFRRS